MPDRTLNWGDPADAGTKYRTQDDDPAGGGNFVVAEDLDGNTVLLQYNPTAGQWEYSGPVDMGGNDISNVGTISADTLEAGETFTEPMGARLEQTSDQTISNNTLTELSYDSATELNSQAPQFADLAANGVTIPNSDYSYARVSLGLNMRNAIDWKFLIPRVNGSLRGGVGFINYQGGTESIKSDIITTGWFDVSSGNTITAEYSHTAGSDQDTNSSSKGNFLQVEVL